MSPEPEKPIESLLRRYARKRRESSGDSWQVPPETRRLLQKEVSRRLAGSKTEGGSLLHQLFLLDWLRPLAAMTGVAVLILGAWLFLGRQAEHTTKSEFSSTGSAGSPTSGMVQLAANDKASSSELESANRLEKSKQVAATRNAEEMLQAGKDSEALQSPGPGETQRDSKPPTPTLDVAMRNREDQSSAALGASVTPSAPAPDLGRVSATAASGIAAPLTLTPEKKAEAESEAEKRSSLVNEPLAMKSAAADALTVSKEMAKPGQNATNVVQLGSFAGSQAVTIATTEAEPLARGLSPSITRFAALRKTEAMKRVLTSFQLEQAGSELRVIDSDGSVYAGSILTTNPASSVMQVSSSLSDTRQRSERQTESGLNTAIQEPVGQSVFQLIGTNKSLNRRLVFAGILSTNQNSAGSQFKARTYGVGGALKGVRTNEKLQNLHLSGTAVIEGEQPIRIEAERAVR